MDLTSTPLSGIPGCGVLGCDLHSTSASVSCDPLAPIPAVPISPLKSNLLSPSPPHSPNTSHSSKAPGGGLLSPSPPAASAVVPPSSPSSPISSPSLAAPTSLSLRFSLPAIFRSLPKPTIGRATQETVDPTLQESQNADAGVPEKADLYLRVVRGGMSDSSRTEGGILGKKTTPLKGNLLSLPDQPLIQVLSMLGPTDLQAASATCRHLRDLASTVVPHLRLSLFPHQRDLLRWMVHRETAPRRIGHPLVKSLRTREGVGYCCDLVTGAVKGLVTGSRDGSRGGSVTALDFKGGLCCDEPGLGKTVSALSLILKTRGQRPHAPRGAEVVVCPHVWGSGDGSTAREGADDSAPFGEGNAKKGRGRGRGKGAGTTWVSPHLPMDNHSADLAGIQEVESDASWCASRQTAYYWYAPGGKVEGGQGEGSGEPGGVGGAASPGNPARREGVPCKDEVEKGKVQQGVAGEPEVGTPISEAPVDPSVVMSPPMLSCAGEDEEGAKGGGMERRRSRRTAETVRVTKPGEPGVQDQSKKRKVEGLLDLVEQVKRGARRARTTRTSRASLSGMELLGSGGIGKAGGGGSAAAESSGSRGREREETQNGAEEVLDAAKAGGEGNGRDAADSSSSEQDAATWVQCDLCSRWRKLPSGFSHKDGLGWFCSMNPDRARNTCGAPEEEQQQEGEVIFGLPGFKRSTEGPGAHPENVAFFSEKLVRKLRVVDMDSRVCMARAATWLGGSEPEKLDLLKTREGLLVPSEVASLLGAEGLFRSLGLEVVEEGEGEGVGAVAKQTAKRGRNRGGAGRGGGSVRGSSLSEDAEYRARPSTSNARKGRKRICLRTYDRLARVLLFDGAALLEAAEKVVTWEGFLKLDQLHSPHPSSSHEQYFLSPATLIVVPSPLIQHWLTQIQQHVRPGALRVLVYDGPGTAEGMPEVHRLAWDYDIVLTTFQRLSVEWSGALDMPLMAWGDEEEGEEGERVFGVGERAGVGGEEEGEGKTGLRGDKGEFLDVGGSAGEVKGGSLKGAPGEEEVRPDGAPLRRLRRSRKEAGLVLRGFLHAERRKVDLRKPGREVKEKKLEDSMLLRVHWLRVILDEGHTLGASLAMTNKLEMAVALRASRRWILTGTPTPNTPNSQVAHLFPLLRFLHDHVFGPQQRVWESAIQRPFEAGREEGRARLVALLGRTMFVSRKEDIRTIPPCHRKVKLLPFRPEHGLHYNELVETVQRNLLLADWHDPEHRESLLHPSQLRLARMTLHNVRLSCCVAGQMQLYDLEGEVDETVAELVEKYGLEKGSATASGIKAALKHGGDCDRCRAHTRLPLVTPCCHLLCNDCAMLDKTRCTALLEADPSQGQLVQCVHKYVMRVRDSRAGRKRPPGLEGETGEWDVPQYFIELQPSYKQRGDEWHAGWQDTKSSKVAYLLNRIREITEKESPGNPPSLSQCSPSLYRGGVFSGDAESDGGAKEEEVDVVALGEGSSYNVKGGRGSSPPKVIVFSQFLEHIHLVETQLLLNGIGSAGLYSPKPLAEKMRELRRFLLDPGCTVLLLDSSGSLGLDLSFVSFLFLMEPLWDRSLEEQVVARAHRMGARGPVTVEVLAMEGTLEEHMLELMKGLPEGRVRQREAQQATAIHTILQGLRKVPVKEEFGGGKGGEGCTNGPLLLNPGSTGVESLVDAEGEEGFDGPRAPSSMNELEKGTGGTGAGAGAPPVNAESEVDPKTSSDMEGGTGFSSGSTDNSNDAHLENLPSERASERDVDFPSEFSAHDLPSGKSLNRTLTHKAELFFKEEEDIVQPSHNEKKEGRSEGFMAGHVGLRHAHGPMIKSCLKQASSLKSTGLEKVDGAKHLRSSRVTFAESPKPQQ